MLIWVGIYHLGTIDWLHSDRLILGIRLDLLISVIARPLTDNLLSWWHFTIWIITLFLTDAALVTANMQRMVLSVINN